MAASYSACGCKGIRTCLICESLVDSNVHKRLSTTVKNIPDTDMYMCYNCGNVIIGEEMTAIITQQSEQTPLKRCVCQTTCILTNYLCSPDHVTVSDNQCVEFSGVTIVKNFISPILECYLIQQIDSSRWAESQSGRMKQDYGPKVNFKKSKVKLGQFNGLPSYSKDIIAMFSTVPLLMGFIPIEQCNLDYNHSRGSAIDPHRDDHWIWGDRLVTINLLSDTYLSFTHTKFSLTVNIPLPRRSLVIVMGVARNEWEHSIKRENVIGRRIAMTMRELGEDFTEGHKDEEIGQELKRIALLYTGRPIN